MNDDLDLRLDEQLRRSFRAAALPAAPPSLRAALDELPRTPYAPRAAGPLRAWVGLGMAAVILIAVAAFGGLFRASGPGVPVSPTQTPLPSPSPSPTPSPSGSATTSVDAYSVGQILEARSNGLLRRERVALYGWYGDQRHWPMDSCPSAVAAALEVTCSDEHQGVVDREGLPGSIEGGRWQPATDAVVHPYWPPESMARPRVAALLAAALQDPATTKPMFVFLAGHFDDARAADCPPAARPRCADRFVVDDVIQFDDPYAVPSPTPRATPFPFGSPPPAPASMASCTAPRSPESALPGDPPLVLESEGWVGKSDLAFDFVGSEIAADVLYVGTVAGDVPLGAWLDDADGRYRWWGRSVCAADANGIHFVWLPGSTFRVYDDGRRVDGGDPFEGLPSAEP